MEYDFIDRVEEYDHLREQATSSSDICCIHERKGLRRADRLLLCVRWFHSSSCFDQLLGRILVQTRFTEVNVGVVHDYLCITTHHPNISTSNHTEIVRDSLKIDSFSRYCHWTLPWKEKPNNSWECNKSSYKGIPPQSKKQFWWRCKGPFTNQNLETREHKCALGSDRLIRAQSEIFLSRQSIPQNINAEESIKWFRATLSIYTNWNQWYFFLIISFAPSFPINSASVPKWWLFLSRNKKSELALDQR